MLEEELESSIGWRECALTVSNGDLAALLQLMSENKVGLTDSLSFWDYDRY